MPFGRTAIGQSAGVACVSCHDHGHGSVDPASTPGNVSVGAGWTYNNSLPTFDSAFYPLHLWNGRIDSLWAQAVADNENPLTTNGNRLHTAWLINDHYGATSTASPNYPAVFADPLPPFGGPSSSVQAMVDATGQCPPPVNGVCPTAGCRARHHDGDEHRRQLLAAWSRSRGSPGRWLAVSRAWPASRLATPGIAWTRTFKRPSRACWSTSARRSPPTKGR